MSRGRADVATVLGVTVLVAAAGPVVGAVWAAIAPHARGVVRAGGVVVDDRDGQAFIAADGQFAVLGLAAGIAAAVLVFLARRRHGVAAALGLTLGGLAGSVLAWQTGMLLGPDTASLAANGAEAGTRFDAPLRLRATGVLVVWPLVAVTAHLVLTAALDRVDPPGAFSRDERSGPAPQP